MTTRVARRHGLTFHHRNEAEFELLYSEIFEGGEYRLATDRLDPRILDCGSHIGLSVAWFKLHYPGSRIVAFEPDPESFRLLRMNVEANGLQGVELVHGAVAMRAGVGRLYGDFESASPMACAHSLRPEWGSQRAGDSIAVRTVLLGPYLSEPVDYLKLDIEGLETEVLPSIRDRLHVVRSAAIEFHGTGSGAAAGEAALADLLRESGFQVSVTIKPEGSVFSSDVDEWVRRARPRLSVIHASRATE